MSDARLDAAAIASEVLQQGGALRLTYLLERGVDVATLRELARSHDVAIKGYRIDRAPAAKIAPALAKLEGDALDEVCAAVLAALSSKPAQKKGGSAKGGANKVAKSDHVTRATHDRTLRELASAQAKLERAEAQLARQRTQVDELQQQLLADRESAARGRSRERALNQEVQALRADKPVTAASSDLSHQIHDLERDLETLGEAEAGLRRLLALRETRLREAEAQIAELEELVPKGRRRKRRPPPSDDDSKRLRVPYFTESFYRSLDGKDRQNVDRAIRAVFVLCTEGPAYPGLEVKQIEGQDLWSFRASLKLRVYFRMRDSGDVDILELADREDQNTALRRLKER